MSEGTMSSWYERPEVRGALAERDVAAVYRLLQRAGISQREIARRTGQCQSDVSEIVAGRAVRDVTVLERICDGLGVPRELMRLSGGDAGDYPGESSTDEISEGAEEVEATRRRDLLARAGVAVAGRPVHKLGMLLGLPAPALIPLPARIEGVHVTQVHTMTRRLGEASNALTSPEVLSAAAAWAQRLLSVPGDEPVRHALMVAIAELHMEAAWAGFEAWRYDWAAHHFSAALELATTAGDTYLQAEALIQAGAVTREFGHPNDGLKLLQLGQLKALDIPHDEPRAVVIGSVGRAAVQATARVAAAEALADLGHLDHAEGEMAQARELWAATRTDSFGDLDRPAARLALGRGELDVAESLAAASVRRWEGVNHRGHAHSSIVLATVHVQAGEPSGLPFAHHAIAMAGKLSSVRIRRQLQPLATALATRGGEDAQVLARMAQAVTSGATA